MKHLNIIILFLVIWANVLFVRAQEFSGEIKQNLQKVIADKLEAENDFVAAISAAVYIPGEGFWEGAVGLSSRGNASTTINTDTLFHIYSVTKTFTAALILDLMAEGKINLDEPISNYFNVSGNVNIDGSIKIKQLLTHTSGIGDYVTNPLFQFTVLSNPAKVWKPTELLAFCGAPVFAPGEDAMYSSTNYILLGLIAESVTEESYHNLLRQRYFGPLELKTMSMSPQEEPRDNVANPHDLFSLVGGSTNEIVDISLFLPLEGLVSTTWSTGGIIASAEDVTLWADALFSGRAMQTAAYDSMMQSLDYYELMAYGVHHKNHVQWGALGHNGGAVGYRASMTHIPDENISIAVLVNEGYLVIDQNEIDAIARDLYRVVTKNPAASVARVGEKPKFSLYPNPAGSELRINYQSIKNQILKVEVLDMQGKLLAQYTAPQLPQNTLTIPLANWPQGIYMVRMSTNTASKVQKFIKQ